jgi:hypothetical protein
MCHDLNVETMQRNMICMFEVVTFSVNRRSESALHFLGIP